jgi:hypothetical protein
MAGEGPHKRPVEAEAAARTIPEAVHARLGGYQSLAGSLAGEANGPRRFCKAITVECQESFAREVADAPAGRQPELSHDAEYDLFVRPVGQQHKAVVLHAFQKVRGRGAAGPPQTAQPEQRSGEP